MRLELWLTLESDATFGRGDGVAGLVDAEIEYDPGTGMPLLRGRTLKGLLVEECANILYALEGKGARFTEPAQFLFGRAGSRPEDDALMHVGAAAFPSELQEAIKAEIEAERLTVTEVLSSVTAIRRQTAVDEATGAPAEGSLRSMRVLLRQTRLVSYLDFDRPPDDQALALLSACVLALRRAGMGRNRGRGRLTATLQDETFTATHFARFKQLVTGDGA